MAPPPLPDLQLHSHAPLPCPPPSSSAKSAPLSSGLSAFSSLAAAAVPAPFLTKTYDLVNDEGTDAVISWNGNGDGFIVWDVQMLCQGLLPRLFRHSNFASFVRQLNIYGFRKIDPEQWEFANCEFVRGQRHQLGCIRRKGPPNTGALHHHHQPQYAVRSPSSSMLLPDSDSMAEVRKQRIAAQLGALQNQVHGLKQQLHQTDKQCQGLWQRLQMSKRFEQHMMDFMAKAMRDPSFLSNLAQQPATHTRRILQVPKRQRLTATPAFSLESSHRMDMADVGSGSGVYEARSPDQQACSATESVHQSPIQLSPYPSREQESDESAGSPASTQAAESSSREADADARNEK